MAHPYRDPMAHPYRDPNPPTGPKRTPLFHPWVLFLHGVATGMFIGLWLTDMWSSGASIAAIMLAVCMYATHSLTFRLRKWGDPRDLRRDLLCMRGELEQERVKSARWGAEARRLRHIMEEQVEQSAKAESELRHLLELLQKKSEHDDETNQSLRVLLELYRYGELRRAAWTSDNAPSLSERVRQRLDE